jgi:hypothetical protein
MAKWSLATSRSSGYKVTATDYNLLIDNSNWFGSGTANVGRCSVGATSTATTNIAAGTWTLMTFSGEDWDTASMHSTVTNTSRLTIPTDGDGLYLITGHVTMANINQTDAAQIMVRKNSAGDYNTGTMLAQHSVMMTETGLVLTGLSITTMCKLVASDYVEMFIRQDHSATVALTGTTCTHRFSAIWQSA